MLGSIFGTRKPSTVTRRTSRSSKTGKSSGVVEQDNDEAEAKVAQTPDVEELRKRRQSYYSLSPAQRRQLGSSTTTTSKTRSSKPSSAAKSTATKDGVRRRRKPASSSSELRKTRPSSKGTHRTEDFVYGQCQPSPADQAAARPVADRDNKPSGRREAQRSGHKTSSRTVSSKRRSLPTVVETEVTPDDSISQVAERRAAQHDARHTSKTSSRPAMKRSRTTTTKLSSVAEVHDQASQALPASKRSSKLLSSLLPPPAPSRRHSTTAIPSTTKFVDCLTCGADDIPPAKSALLACNHRMCHACLRRIFTLSVKDPAHMPPRCCTDAHVPLSHVDKLFDTKFKMLWNRKYQEYHTKNRVYCPTAKCGEWIKPKHFRTGAEGRRYAVCPRCRGKVCVSCSGKMHKAAECPKDPEIARLVAQAKEEGWQRCYSCRAMVELREGCNHITCRCTAEFCICCGAPWKTCSCPWFNYSTAAHPDQLGEMRVPEPIRVAYRRVVDAAGGVAPPPGARDARQPVPMAVPQPEVTYQQELDARRRQERDDAELARRLQLASLWDDEPVIRNDDAARRTVGDATWGIGNAAGHHMNEDFVVQRDAGDVSAGVDRLGDAGFGRRGERASGRRRRARTLQAEGGGEGGLVPDFLGSESVLGMGLPPPVAGGRR